MIRAKRVYEPPEIGDGRRVLIDRLWPRGLSRAAARVDEWRPDLAPSAALRTWFGHAPERFVEFRVRYREELADRAPAVDGLVRAARNGTVTLLFGARDAAHSNAAVLLGLVEERLAKGRGRRIRAVPKRSVRRSTREVRR